MLYRTKQIHITNKVIANAIASFAFALVVIYTAVAMFRIQDAGKAAIFLN